MTNLKSHTWKNAYLSMRFERTSTIGTGAPATTTDPAVVVGPISRPTWRDGSHPLAGDASNFVQFGTGAKLSTTTTTQYFKLIARVLPMSFQVVFKITQYLYDGSGRSLPPAISYSDPVTFTIPDAEAEYAFTIPVPSANQDVTIYTVTTKLPA